jgi:predicted metal-dependent hydrolase
MSDPPIEVIRSTRRRRTVAATLVDGRIRVRVPQGLDPRREAELVEQASRRVLQKVASHGIDLLKRAETLAVKYGLPKPVSVDWSSRQMQRWGSCTPGEGHIRVSNRLKLFPGWVLDSVLVHELAHLEVANHGPEFDRLVSRYELTERARGYLIAKNDGRTI